MAAQKTGIPKGTRDFLPLQTVRRNYIFNTIKKVFELYGYMPIETPAMENLSTLMGKYGEEGDKLGRDMTRSGEHFTGFGIEGGIQRQRAMSIVLKAMAFGAPRRQRQSWSTKNLGTPVLP